MSLPEFGKPILKGNVRILRPVEYEALREGADGFSPPNAVNLDALLTTAVRYVEAQRLQTHPEWFDGNFVYLPREAQLKVESEQRERWIRMGAKGCTSLALFWGNRKLPVWQTWRENLVRWSLRVGLDPVGMSPKTTRKTYESWLVNRWPERDVEISARQGHTPLTARRHYLNMPFLPEDKEAMKPWTDGVF